MAKALNDIVLSPAARAALELRYWPKVAKGGDDECWNWIAKAKHPYGYGRMTAGRRINLKAHQVGWALQNGPIPDGKSILHSCDNPSCCNPRHLFLGTQLDNMGDAKAKGRVSKPPVHSGETHHNSKLSDGQIAAIRLDGRSAPRVASTYGVSTKTVYRIRWGQR